MWASNEFVKVLCFLPSWAGPLSCQTPEPTKANSCLSSCIGEMAGSINICGSEISAQALQCLQRECVGEGGLASAIASLAFQCRDLRRRQDTNSTTGNSGRQIGEQLRKLHDKQNLYFACVLFGLVGLFVLMGFITHTFITLSSYRMSRSRKGISGQNAGRARGFKPLRRLSGLFRGYLLLPAAFGSRHLRPWGNFASVPTRLNFLLVSGYIFLNLMFSVMLLKEKDDIISRSTNLGLIRAIADRTGYLSAANLPLFFLFAGKTKVLQVLTGWGAATFAVFHRWIARVAILLAVIHSIAYIVIRVQLERQGVDRPFNKKYWTNGMAATIVMVSMQLLSFLPIRRRFFETFVFVHRLSAILFLVFVWGHLNLSISKAYHPYLYTCVGLWAQERLFRWIRVIRQNATNTYLARIRKIEGTESFKLTVYLDKEINYFPGAHYYIYFGGLMRLYQCHPFTAISYRRSHKHKGDEDRDRLRLNFLISPRKGLTSSVRKLIKEDDKRARLTVLVEGPYGTHHPLDTYHTVVLIAGGIGITASVPHVKDYYLRKVKRDKTLATQKIILFWNNPDYGLMEKVWKQELLPFIRDQRTGKLDSSIEALWYCTNATPNIIEKAKLADVGEEMVDVRFQPRGSVRDLVKVEVAREKLDPSGYKRSLAFVACGPAPMVDDVRECVAQAVAEGAEGVGYFEESFGM